MDNFLQEMLHSRIEKVNEAVRRQIDDVSDFDFPNFVSGTLVAEPGAVVEDCVVRGELYVEAGCRVIGCVVDKLCAVYVRSGSMLVGSVVRPDTAGTEVTLTNGAVVMRSTIEGSGYSESRVVVKCDGGQVLRSEIKASLQMTKSFLYDVFSDGNMTSIDSGCVLAQVDLQAIMLHIGPRCVIGRLAYLKELSWNASYVTSGRIALKECGVDSDHAGGGMTIGEDSVLLANLIVTHASKVRIGKRFRLWVDNNRAEGPREQSGVCVGLGSLTVGDDVTWHVTPYDMQALGVTQILGTRRTSITHRAALYIADRVEVLQPARDTIAFNFESLTTKPGQKLII